MSDLDTIFVVTISGNSTEIENLVIDDDGFDEARGKVILRERDAIELHRNNSQSGDCDGSYHFFLLDTAKYFALLHLKFLEQAIEDNLDRIQNYSL